MAWRHHADDLQGRQTLHQRRIRLLRRRTDRAVHAGSHARGIVRLRAGSRRRALWPPARTDLPLRSRQPIHQPTVPPRLEKYGIEQSMGRSGSCYDNARMESFWATLKKELRYRLPLSTLTRSQVRSIIFRWVECHYNTRRPHSANPDYLPPLAFRRCWTGTAILAA